MFGGLAHGLAIANCY